MKNIISNLTKSILLSGSFFLSITACTQTPGVITIEHEKNLIPEGIAIHPTTGTIYISSIAQHKVIEIDPSGVSKDFIPKDRDGYLEGLGLKVDVKRNLLWALSNIREGKLFTSQIHAFDLNTAETKHHFILKDTIPHLFNDLVIESSGTLLITDTYYSCLFRYDPTKKALTHFIKAPVFKYPNGLALDENNTLYLATYGNGLLKINIENKEVKSLSGFKDSLLAYGLDGLVFHEGFLYGVYNAKKYNTNAVVRYKLDKQREKIIEEKIIDQAKPYFHDPTTAAFHKGKLYVIANSHLDQYNANKESIKGIEDDLKPLMVLVYQID